MNYSKHTKVYYLLNSTILAVLVISLMFMKLPMLCAADSDAQTHDFKMISTIEYSGKGQYRSQAETVFTVNKQTLSDDMVSYKILTKPVSSTSKTDTVYSVPDEMSFVLNKDTRQIISESDSVSLLEKINNQCTKSFTKLSTKDIGRTWEQSFRLSVPSVLLPEEYKFSLKAIGLKTDAYGEMIAVRAISQPFVLYVTGNKGKTEPIKCKISTVYLFDSEVENIYLSVSVFEGSTKMNGYDETVWHEVATYRLTDQGKAVDLTGLSKDFEQLVRKLGLKRNELKVVDKVSLPQWVRYDLLKAAQAANICAATASEGAINPVITICAASSRVFELQVVGKLATTGSMVTVSNSLVHAVPGVGAMKIAAAPAFAGVGVGTAGAAAGATGGAIAIANNGSSSSDERSPTD